MQAQADRKPSSIFLSITAIGQCYPIVNYEIRNKDKSSKNRNRCFEQRKTVISLQHTIYDTDDNRPQKRRVNKINQRFVAVPVNVYLRPSNA